jgi:hypothetical protein
MRPLILTVLFLSTAACTSAGGRRAAEGPVAHIDAPCVDSAGLVARPVSPVVDAPDSVLLRRPIPPEIIRVSPPKEGLAASKSWYRAESLICYRGRRFGPWGYPLVSYETPEQVGGTFVYRVGSFDGVPIFAKRDEPEVPEVIYLMLNSAGQYAPYIWKVLMR